MPAHSVVEQSEPKPTLNESKRAPPQMMKFAKGETVVDPTIGICVVLGMTKMHVDKEDMVMYIFEAHGAKIMVPEKKVEERGIRRPMSRDDVKRVLASMKNPVAPNRNDARLQYVNYRDVMKSGDPAKITRLLRDLFILDQTNDLKGKEKEIMEQARKFLCDEIAFVREVSKTQVLEIINEALRGMFKKKQARDKEKAKRSGTGLSMGILGYEDDEIEDFEDEEDIFEVKARAKAASKAESEEEFVDEDDAEEVVPAKKKVFAADDEDDEFVDDDDEFVEDEDVSDEDDEDEEEED
ncbi:MAG: CarD family transcriptional regulator [Sumerlaeia bacterium]